MRTTTDRDTDGDIGYSPSSNTQLVGCLNRKHNTNPAGPLVRSRPFTPWHMNIRVRHRSVVFLAAPLSIGAQPLAAQAPLTVASPDSRTSKRTSAARQSACD